MMLRRLPQYHPWLNSPLVAQLTGVSLFLIFILLTEFLIGFQQREMESLRRVDTLAFASNLRARAERDLNTALFVSNGLAAYLAVRRDQINDKEIQAIQAELYKNVKNVRSFSIAIGYTIRHVFPIAENQRAIGLDYSRTPAQWPDVERAITTRRGTLVGPLRLAQGGVGLIYRYPVFADNHYWGMLSTVIDLDGFVRSAFALDEDNRYEFAVASRKGGFGEPDVFWGNPSLFKAADTLFVEADVPNGKWIFAVRSREAAPSQTKALILRVIGALMAALIGIAAFLTLKHRIAFAELALYDSLTGLPNRRLLEDRLRQTISRQSRRPGGSCAVLFIDLDKFKAINDTYGHRAGDLVLTTIAQRVREEVRVGDTVARWGGDELVAIIEDTDPVQIEQLVARIRACVTLPVEQGSDTLSVGASIGVAFFPDDDTSALGLLKIADQRMYDDKQRPIPP